MTKTVPKMSENRYAIYDQNGLKILDWDMFLRRNHFLVIIEHKINKSPLQIMFTVIYNWSELLLGKYF